jgi:acetyltransferase-like isoleucine patch superfamily enzyme
MKIMRRKTVAESSNRVSRIHPTAEVSPEAILGENVTIWNQAQVLSGASVGANSIISKNVYIGFSVSIGKNCKIQNNVSVFRGVMVEDGVFIGPHVCFTNDLLPRAINPDGSLKGADDWNMVYTVVEYGASIGANSVILPGIRLGRFCMVGAGSVVTHSVPANGLVLGNPARLAGWVCDCGFKLQDSAYIPSEKESVCSLQCDRCGRRISMKERE